HWSRFLPNRLLGADLFCAQRFLQPLRFASLVFADCFMARLLVARLLAAGPSAAPAGSGGLLVPAWPIAAVPPAAAALLLAFARTTFVRRLVGAGVRLLG